MQDRAQNTRLCRLPTILIRGAGDLASGVAIRLFRSRFPVLITEIERPLTVRRAVSFAQAVYDGETHVEEVRAVRCSVDMAAEVVSAGAIPVMVDALGECRHVVQPYAVIDAIMAKRNSGTHIEDAPFVVGLGPGFTAGEDCHATIETNRGHNLGRVLWRGATESDTGVPGTLPGLAPGLKRALYAPVGGKLAPCTEIGDKIEVGQTITEIVTHSSASVTVAAPFDGVLRGLIHPSVEFEAGTKIGDLDPRLQPGNCFTVSDKSMAIGGAVLEAILARLQMRSVSALKRN